MYTDASAVPDGSLIEGDLCIIGAGAAGISMALEWANGSQRVILLEGGGFDVDSEIQDLYRGEIVGQHYYPMQSARLHFFGGTTGHWGGFCSRFDPWDFEKRTWVPGSGWPFGLRELIPYYERAEAIVELDPKQERWDISFWTAQERSLTTFPFDPSKVWSKMWQFSRPTRFGTHYRDDIVYSTNIHLYTHANVCDIVANESVNAIREVEVRSMNGKKHRVRAKHFVLACGAIQNARLLLASNKRAPRGIGNDRDLVGRYFMEHIEAPVALLTKADATEYPLYSMGPKAYMERRARAEFVLSYEEQARLKILNCSASLAQGRSATEIDQTNRIDTYPETAEAVLQMIDQMEKAFASGMIPEPDLSQITTFGMNCRSETAPNPDSRVLLDEETDALGMPRAKLDWQLTDLDKRTLVKTFEAIGAEAGRSGVGRVKLRDWILEDDPFGSPDSLTAAGWHHMGTTRMHEDPSQGVVDANCTVHGIGNLHVAGSGAFTTSGVANPTLTLIALTLRLADHLKTKL